MTPKRKATEAAEEPSSKRPATSTDIKSCFGLDLFEPPTIEALKCAYAGTGGSGPFKHGVISSLIDDDLLRAVRSEITTNISFTPKETDIYKIHQSGDLANLDGLDPAALERLPSLVKLRDAMYSHEFREYLSDLTKVGKLSGKKTDMAINVYTPGCHLLCHDDVIGSRRVSYILYLTNPNKPWLPEWGGALRLYPSEEKTNQKNEKVMVPLPDHSRSIPPAFGQLSFFPVQPGLSYHDVEEVYAREPDEREEDDTGRVRMAISGWYHIPQEGEEGYVEGAEEEQAERSSLAQLQGKADEFEEPKPNWKDFSNTKTLRNGRAPDTGKEPEEEFELSEEDLDFLVKYVNPRYLTPDTVASLRKAFTEDSSLRLAMFLSSKVAPELRRSLSDLEKPDAKGVHAEGWRVARPPHKHRYLYCPVSEVFSADSEEAAGDASFGAILHELIPSLAFRKWLCLATGLKLGESDVLARRYRKGKDYSLATGYNDEDPQLEVCLGLTPTEGWGSSTEEDAEVEATAGVDETTRVDHNDSTEQTKHTQDSSYAPKTGNCQFGSEIPTLIAEEPNFGGYEAYLAGDEDDDSSSVDAPLNPSSATGAGQRRSTKADPAVYQAGGEQDEDDGVLFNQPASWNTLTVVLRDKGTMRFVKYVSQSAPGDRWDISGAWKVNGSLDSDDEEDEADDGNSDEDGGDDRQSEGSEDSS